MSHETAFAVHKAVSISQTVHKIKRANERLNIMKVETTGRELSNAQKFVLSFGYCVLHGMDTPFACSGLSYREWSDLCDAKFIKHQKSCLSPDWNPDVFWERYRVTPLGKAAI